MSSQLDILALEPFYGGVRRAMLESLIRASRHRWTLFKLPPRRMERRLTAAAHWFSEQLARHWVGKVDVIFTSEAMNLADLIRLMPPLGRKRSVVYFHANQLPPPESPHHSALDLVNLNTAMAANEIWFNSVWHLQTFLHRASALVDRHSELSNRNPMPQLAAKSHLVYPPTNLDLVHEMMAGPKIAREPHTIFVNTRDADCQLLNQAMAVLKLRQEKFHLMTVGPTEELDPNLPRTTLPENDEVVQVQAMRKCDVILSVKPDAPSDHHMLMAIAAGCWPAVPDAAVYREMIPESLQDDCVYRIDPGALATRLQDIWDQTRISARIPEFEPMLDHYAIKNACKVVDERLTNLVATP